VTVAFHDPVRPPWALVNRVRGESLLRAAPELFDGSIGGPTLYIGANTRRADFLDQLPGPVRVLEVWEANVALLRAQGVDVFHGDVRTWIAPMRFNVTFWWHGPEHIDAAELPDVLRRIEAWTDRIVVLGCPWGEYVQDAVGGNPHEVHRQAIQPVTLAALGYDCDVTGREGPRSNICAVRRLQESGTRG
jgi:hypothetical protein